MVATNEKSKTQRNGLEIGDLVCVRFEMAESDAEVSQFDSLEKLLRRRCECLRL